MASSIIITAKILLFSAISIIFVDMKALVLGATGAIGKDLVGQLLQDDTFDRVDIFVRREVKIPSAKLVAHVVDFDHPEQWADKLTGDVLFSTLGTTIKAAGSQKAQWKVDYTMSACNRESRF